MDFGSLLRGQAWRMSSAAVPRGPQTCQQVLRCRGVRLLYPRLPGAQKRIPNMLVDFNEEAISNRHMSISRGTNHMAGSRKAFQIDLERDGIEEESAKVSRLTAPPASATSALAAGPN